MMGINEKPPKRTFRRNMELIFIFGCVSVALGMTTIEHLELVMPRYVAKGGDVVIRCDHDVPPEQLYKVEWRKERVKIFRYIKGRQPPYVAFAMQGALLVGQNSSEQQIHLTNLDLSASGTYTCEVSMETPIFSKESDPKMLTVIEPQKNDPLILFTKPTYEIGEVLEANCTAGPSRPAPHITWLINGQKVNDSLTKLFIKTGFVYGSQVDSLASSTKLLSVEVSELHVGDDDVIRLTCVATIPSYVYPSEEYADVRKSTAVVDVKITEVPAEAISNGGVGGVAASAATLRVDFAQAVALVATVFVGRGVSKLV